ncbi:peptidase associated/transthyretin-like domain-containing protein [Sphingobacterium endophyticum]|uniref:hypothetical protein n=1 Tax=Sphingobacterium endophyticum TaxID=2546448 RepID=UPI0012E167BD|nr:hypothetical protein [Sphingobacterium endophyticum]
MYSCRTSNNYYQGKIIDENGKPIEWVAVFEVGSMDSRRSKSDSNGYFKLSRSPDWLGTLIFFGQG